MGAAPATDRIRAFREEDIPQVTDLHIKVFGAGFLKDSPELREEYLAYFKQVFLDDRWRNEDAGPLVHQDRDGKVTGFIGSALRPMVWGGQPILARVSAQFMVDPESRGWVGVNLLNRFMRGPQDLTIVDEANTASRLLWEGLGGTTALGHSMRWLYPIRPARLGLSLLLRNHHSITRFAMPLATPATKPLDAMASRILKRRFKSPQDDFSGADVTENDIDTCLAEFNRREGVRPDYTPQTYRWLLMRARQMKRNGRFRMVIVRTKEGKVAGWYLYYVKPGGISEVLQVYATPDYMADVVEHLFRSAREDGATGLSGRLDHAIAQTLSERGCVFACGLPWFLVHSRRPELVNTFHHGKAFFSRIDGEFCLRLR